MIVFGIIHDPLDIKHYSDVQDYIRMGWIVFGLTGLVLGLAALFRTRPRKPAIQCIALALITLLCTPSHIYWL